MANMKILTLARKCGKHAALFACFKVSAVPNCYRYLEIGDLDDEKLGDSSIFGHFVGFR
jgi:hypothetical protein